MDTAEKIQPALTAEEWRTVTLWLAGKMVGGKVRGSVVRDLPTEHQVAAIAFANAALPDSDPRKITRKWVDALHTECGAGDWFGTEAELEEAVAAQRRILRALANALESYLPPK